MYLRRFTVGDGSFHFPTVRLDVRTVCWEYVVRGVVSVTKTAQVDEW